MFTARAVCHQSIRTTSRAKQPTVSLFEPHDRKDTAAQPEAGDEEERYPTTGSCVVMKHNIKNCATLSLEKRSSATQVTPCNKPNIPRSRGQVSDPVLVASKYAVMSGITRVNEVNTLFFFFHTNEHSLPYCQSANAKHQSINIHFHPLPNNNTTVRTESL